MYFPVSEIQRLKLLSYCLFFFLTHCIHLITIFYHFGGFPGGTSGKEPTCQCRRHEMLVLSPGGRAWQSTPVFLPGESHGRGDWWATVHRVVYSQTQLKQLSTCHFYYLNIILAKEISLAPARTAKSLLVSLLLSASLKHVIQSCQIVINSNFLQLLLCSKFRVDCCDVDTQIP